MDDVDDVDDEDCVIVKSPEVLLHPLPDPCKVHVPVTVPPVIEVPLKVPVTLVLVRVRVLPFSVTVKENVLLTSWSAELKFRTNVPVGVNPVTCVKHPLEMLLRN